MLRLPLPRNGAIANTLGPGPEDPFLWDRPLTPWDRSHALGPGPGEYHTYGKIENQDYDNIFFSFSPLPIVELFFFFFFKFV